MNDVAGRTILRRERSEAKRERSRTLYFLAASVLATLIPLIFFAGFWIRSELNKSQRALETFLTSRCDALSQRTDGLVQNHLSALQVVAALPALEIDSTALHAEAMRVLEGMPAWTTIKVVDPANHQMVIDARRDPRSTGPPLDRDSIDRVARTRSPLVTSLASTAQDADGSRNVLLYVPTVRENAIQYVVVAELKSESFQQLVGLPDDGDVFLLSLVNEHRRIFARSRSPEEFVGRETGADFQRLVGTQSAGIFDSRTLDGQAVATAFTRSPLTGWLAVVSMDRREFDRASRQSLWATIVAGALSLTLAGILTVFLFHNVMERRVSNERLSASLALSELDARLLATTQDALGEQRKAASEREVLLREIYHRVKNNLQIVQSLLRLGSRDLTREQREPFENAVRRIGAMARIHTLLYNSPDLASINFKDYLQELVRESSEAFAGDERGIATDLDASSMWVPLDTAVPLAFIAGEILTNAYRHAFPPGRSGQITVSCHREAEQGILTISDNGIGLPAKDSKKRLGLTIAAKLAHQIGGRLEEPGPGGSTFRLAFPLRKDETPFHKPAPGPA